jgi:hypothetical protein
MSPNEINIDTEYQCKRVLDLIGFKSKVNNRVAEHFEDRSIKALSFRKFMDFFLPPASDDYRTREKFYLSIPILKQPQFGPYLFDSALLTMTEAQLGSAFRSEWSSRIYSLKLIELRYCPANKASLKKMKKPAKIIPMYKFVKY